MEKRTQTIQHMMRDPLVLTLSLLANGTDFHQQKYILTCYTYTWAIHIYIYSIFSCSITVTTPPATYTNSQADDGGGWCIWPVYALFNAQLRIFCERQMRCCGTVQEEWDMFNAHSYIYTFMVARNGTKANWVRVRAI